ncbi:30S ribosomal protein S4e [Candidatus Woesearchaeota archaeon]|nr:30S ribosomal protein S4e [Candidatus Woesearchaeota archaeon]
MHIKRHFAPRSWKIERKGTKYVAKPSPGTHELSMSMPLIIIIRDILGYANTKKEVKYILEKRNVTIDGIKRNDSRFPVGLFDVLSFNDTNEHFRIILDEKGKVSLIKIGEEESSIKLCKITGKKIVKGKTQLNLNDGRNIFADGNFKTSDSVLLKLGQKATIKESIGIDKGAVIYLTGGKHIGEIGIIQGINENRILYKTQNNEIAETLKKYAFAVGKTKPLITIAE